MHLWKNQLHELLSSGNSIKFTLASDGGARDDLGSLAGICSRSQDIVEMQGTYVGSATRLICRKEDRVGDRHGATVGGTMVSGWCH
jgi:hypothetical protein